MFRRRSAGATEQAEHPGSTGSESPEEKDVRPAEMGKGRPTPKRREAEKNRYQPITGSRSTASRSTGSKSSGSKTADRAERSRRYDAMRRGEDWALGPRDKGPERKLVRDYVDSKRRVSEYYMYALIILLIALVSRSKSLNDYISPLVLVLIVVVVIDAYLLRRGLRKLLAERLPGSSMRGLTTYAVFRALQIRRFRTPVPRVKPGDKI
jgi:hypothetical protein